MTSIVKRVAPIQFIVKIAVALDIYGSKPNLKRRCSSLIKSTIFDNRIRGEDRVAPAAVIIFPVHPR